MGLVVGIPRALFYYRYYPIWERFFKELGATVLCSPPTSRAIVDMGARECIAEACIPIKLYHGHVAALLDKVDVLFIPRLVSVRPKAVFCPKFLGLPDMVKHSFKHLPRVIDVRVDLRRGPVELLRVAEAVGQYIGASKTRALYALWSALRVLKSSYPSARPPAEGDLRVAVVGYPYEVHDPYVNVGTLEKLRSLGVVPVTVEDLSPRTLKSTPDPLRKHLFWTWSEDTVHAAEYFFHTKSVDGLIHVTAFGCGPDAIVNKCLEIESKKAGAVPFMTLTIDEHTGDAGVRTRLEAFVDMIRRQRSVAGCRS